jgi:hypothetical protein
MRNAKRLQRLEREGHKAQEGRRGLVKPGRIEFIYIGVDDPLPDVPDGVCPVYVRMSSDEGEWKND